ncbi:hypothetical protein MPSEU_000677400 [Mayamaea pseudoterrestris]|nr:hypothetical protein MPSEU_000677400 [Mayamaea pseudoterrestris]
MFLYDRLDYFEQFEKTSNGGVSFMDDIVQSQFSAVPRGDNLFSYRFTEVLSAGAIPIILADGWVLPFSERLVSWESCAVMVPEDQVFQLPFILRAMSVEEQCQRRKTCYDIYRKYMATTEGTIQGILDGLELTYDMRHAPPSL